MSIFFHGTLHVLVVFLVEIWTLNGGEHTVTEHLSRDYEGTEVNRAFGQSIQ